MIRINLTSHRRSRRMDAGQRQLLAMGAALLVVVGGVMFAHIQATGELEAMMLTNNRLQAEIDVLKAELGDYDKVKAQREELLKQRQSIEALDKGRTGPVFLMRELSEILTPGKGPTFDRVAYEDALRRDPNVGFNSSWDTKRVWLETYEEKMKQVRIRGAAKSHEDAAEFMKRLNSSVFFTKVQFENAAQQMAKGDGVRHITFNLKAEVRY